MNNKKNKKIFISLAVVLSIVISVIALKSFSKANVRVDGMIVGLDLKNNKIKIKTDTGEEFYKIDKDTDFEKYENKDDLKTQDIVQIVFEPKNKLIKKIEKIESIKNDLDSNYSIEDNKVKYKLSEEEAVYSEAIKKGEDVDIVPENKTSAKQVSSYKSYDFKITEVTDSRNFKATKIGSDNNKVYNVSYNGPFLEDDEVLSRGIFTMFFENSVDIDKVEVLSPKLIKEQSSENLVYYMLDTFKLIEESDGYDVDENTKNNKNNASKSVVLNKKSKPIIKSSSSNILVGFVPGASKIGFTENKQIDDKLLLVGYKTTDIYNLENKDFLILNAISIQIVN